MNYPVKNIYGKTNNQKISVNVVGSKSITARAMLISALAEGESVLFGAQFSDDCAAFLQCLKTLGIEVETDGAALKIKGCGGRLKKDKAEINVGSAGTAARFLPAFLAFQNGRYVINCSQQMKNRPVQPLTSALSQLGAKIEFFEKEGSFPFAIEGAASPATSLEVDVSKSSQFLSALLISAVCAGKPLTVKPYGSHGLDYVNMTAEMQRAFGAEVKEENGAFTVCGGYRARNYTIEPDISAACYFYAANKILGTQICVEGVGSRSLQGDIKFIKLLQTFDGGEVNAASFSDQALTLAAIAPYFGSPTRITGIGHIRAQECERIKAIAYNLAAMGVKCEEFADGVKIYPSQPKPAIIKTFGDHRVAMSFAVTGLRADGIVIENAEVCSKTFKEFFTVLDNLCARLTAH